jgi:hypothetical protein
VGSRTNSEPKVKKEKKKVKTVGFVIGMIIRRMSLEIWTLTEWLAHDPHLIFGLFFLGALHSAFHNDTTYS